MVDIHLFTLAGWTLATDDDGVWSQTWICNSIANDYNTIEALPQRSASRKYSRRAWKGERLRYRFGAARCHRDFSPPPFWPAYAFHMPSRLATGPIDFLPKYPNKSNHATTIVEKSPFYDTKYHSLGSFETVFIESASQALSFAKWLPF